jgi:colicin import membrane protein
MRIDWTISAVAHAGLLAWGLLTFSAKPFDTLPESIPIDIVSTTQFSQVMPGSKSAPKAEQPKPLVEKVAERKPVEDPTPKPSERKEINAAKAEQPPAPLPERRPKPPKPAASQPKVDPIAEALKKDAAKKKAEAKEEQKKIERKEPTRREQPRFDPSKVAALLDKRDPQRQLATGETLNRTASLGLPTATAASLSQSELDALRRRISQCWNVPVGADGAQDLRVVFRVAFNVDGTVLRGPDVIEATASPYGPAFAESGKRAILQCQPYTMLRRETYDVWKDIEVLFTPRDMFGG